MYDVLISGGRIYDGTGSPWFTGAVAVRDGKVAILRGSTAAVAARETIDATDRIVCPGFIDMHAHSTMVILKEPRHDAKVRQGVTTELIGVDGNSYAPFLSAEDLQAWGVLDAGLDGPMPNDLAWLTVDEYLDVYDGNVAVNIAYVVGNAPLRISAMGWEDRPPTDAEARHMRDLLAQAMEHGALGMSTGLTYPPGSYASPQEVEMLCEVVRDLGGVYVTHVRYGSGDGFLDPNVEALDAARRTGVPLHISHYASTWRKNGQFRPLLELVDRANDDGVQVTFDAYPYVHTGTRALVMLPQWIHDGGVDALKERLRDPRARARMRDETDPRQARWRFGDRVRMTGFRNSANKGFEGLTMAEVAEEMGKDPLDAVCDLLLDEDLGVSQVGLYSNNEVNNRKILAHPSCMVGSDALLVGDYPSPRSYGTFPKVLGDLVREEGLLEMADAIRKMTSFPAQCLGLVDRGVLRDGFAADIVVFDPQTVESPATLEEPRQYPIGIDHVLVNGEIVVRQGEHTGALAGRALRRG